MDHYRAAELALQDERPREAMQHAQACLDAGEERLRAACLDIMRRACQAMDRCTVTVQERGREVVLRLSGELDGHYGVDDLVGATLRELARKGAQELRVLRRAVTMLERELAQARAVRPCPYTAMDRIRKGCSGLTQRRAPSGGAVVLA